MFRRDLDAVGIPYRDDAGRVADFHSLRHTFISNLARGGVHPKVAQQLARHSTITLTMDRYTHTNRGQLVDALSALPDLTPEPCEKEVALATGTDNRIIESSARNSMPSALPSALPFHMPEPGSSIAPATAPNCTLSSQPSKNRRAEKTGKTGVSCTPSHSPASESATDLSLRALGLEPKTYGLKGRCSTIELRPRQRRDSRPTCREQIRHLIYHN